VSVPTSVQNESALRVFGVTHGLWVPIRLGIGQAPAPPEHAQDVPFLARLVAPSIYAVAPSLR
jgi:hypothetical protein